MSGIVTIDDLLMCAGKTVVLDTETTGLRWYSDKLIGLSFYCPEDVAGNESYGYIPTAHYPERPDYISMKNLPEYGAQPDEELIAEVREAVRVLAHFPGTTLVFHNSKFDCHFLNLDMLSAPCKILDTSVLVHLWDSRLRKGLAECEAVFLKGNSKREFSEAAAAKIPKGAKNKVWLWPLDATVFYAQNDAIVTYQLLEVMKPKIEEMKLKKMLNKDMKYIRYLHRMERKGIRLDFGFVRNAIEALKENLSLMEEELFEKTGMQREGTRLAELQAGIEIMKQKALREGKPLSATEERRLNILAKKEAKEASEYELNWRSNIQLSKALYDNMGISKPVNPYLNSKGEDNSKFAMKGLYGGPCTSTFLLMEKVKHPLGRLVMDLRETSKLIKVLEGWLDLEDGEGLIHTNFKLTGTRTGRLSSSEPNMQNVPSQYRVRETQSVYSGGGIRSQEYNLRNSFVSRPGYKFVSIDHRQQEMRMFAIEAKEPIMLQALTDRLDIHKMIAIAVWGDCGPEINKIHREWSKTLGFGLIYGMTTGSLQHRLGNTPEEAERIAGDYRSRFPRIEPWLREVIVSMYRKGYVRNWAGRIWREGDTIHFYKGGNALIQGGAADLMSIAAMRVQDILQAQDWGHVLLIIHDEIVVEVKEEFVEKAVPVLSRAMEVQDLFGYPFSVDAKTGYSLGKWEDFNLPNDLSSIDWKTYAQPEGSPEGASEDTV